MKLTHIEKKAAFSLAGIYGLRMFGLFLVIPVLFIHAQTLDGFTPLLAGLAIGIYGLGQAILQIPFGYLSDRIGRKPVIIIGLLIFALGSLVAAQAESLGMLIFGRALQGAGAIASTLMALAADLSRPELRSRMMAVIGATIGASFILALIAGPWLSGIVGISGLFWVTASLALVAIAVLHWVTPSGAIKAGNLAVLPARQQIASVLRNSQLLRLDLGIFFLHLFLTAIFVIIPGQLIIYGLPLESHSQTYLVLLLGGFILMLPGLVLVEKFKAHKLGFVISVSLLVIANLVMALVDNLTGLLLGLAVFFVTFNFLEASLPALVSRLCSADNRGTAMGVYSTSQFSGAFLGGALAGIILQYGEQQMIFLCLAGFSVIWLLAIISMKSIIK
ncbi:MAG: MFS transporter [Gammaproteobacteria bacterium]|nr:MAG: MFS transporter [Gammaproteobacteria bacterium]